ncbi:hypothetical protein EU555_29680 [Methylobacterium nonmethylotrophicum]|uniref:Uncharacterized protein n=1 Tax=Methylobacterium nonmethylotrophicum TaxID=1141884 RepID=A0A4Z0NHT0_9HYPH|nr:hypothetical protein EU555_29680 [Methylobacterium nonmethylotrophicum]
MTRPVPPPRRCGCPAPRRAGRPRERDRPGPRPRREVSALRRQGVLISASWPGRAAQAWRRPPRPRGRGAGP